MSAPLAFVDCETTGVHPRRRAWEVAIIRREPDGAESTLHAFVRDVDLSEADPYGLRVGRFYERHPTFARIPEAAAAIERGRELGLEFPQEPLCADEGELAPMIERYTRGTHLVGAVPNFDAETFADMLRRWFLTPAWNYHLVDVGALAVGYLAGQAAAARMEIDQSATLPSSAALPWESDELSRACGVEPPSEQDRHTALGDAKWVMRLYDAIIGHRAPEPAHPAEAAESAEVR